VVPDDAFGKHKNTEPDFEETTTWDETAEVMHSVMPVTQELQETTPIRFPELERRIADTIAAYGLAFPKLNWRSPRVRWKHGFALSYLRAFRMRFGWL
jgi:hypothetical protein